jgi:hypothetical protein
VTSRKNVYQVLKGQPEGRRPPGKPTHRWEYNIKMDGMVLSGLIRFMIGTYDRML